MNTPGKCLSKQANHSDASDPTICVIVPAYNAAADIAACLHSLLESGFHLSEICVADDGSTDDTIAICRRIGIGPLQSKVNQGAASTRNRGVAATTADLIVFVDSDVVVHPDVRQRTLDNFQNNPELDAFFGSYDDNPTRQEPVSRIRNLLHHHVHQSNPGQTPSFWTGLGAIRRDALNAVGGFDADLQMMEDIELGARLTIAGYLIKLDPDLLCTHRKYWSLGKMMKTDLFHRAIPWTRLMMSETGRKVPAALNVSMSGKISVIAVAMSIISLLAAIFAPLIALIICVLCVLVLYLANRGFLVRISERDNMRMFAIALGVLWLHYACAGLGFAMARLGYRG